MLGWFNEFGDDSFHHLIQRLLNVGPVTRENAMNSIIEKTKLKMSSN